MIEVLGVKKRYRRKQVIEDVSFTANKGEITCLIGLNGTGKSTLLKGIMGLTPFDKGSVLIDGKPIDLNRVAFVADHAMFPIHFTIEQCEAFMKDFYPTFDSTLFARLVEDFKLFPEDKLSELSKGTLAKANLALGIAQTRIIYCSMSRSQESMSFRKNRLLNCSLVKSWRTGASSSRHMKLRISST
jgi:ABC-2 type transport system ATP-binding protein